MAHFARKAFQLTPNQLMYQQKRYRGKINIRKPKIFFKKAVLNKLLTPFFIDPKDGNTLENFCLNSDVQQVQKELGPYDTILSKELRNWFDKSKMVGCLHQNSIGELEKFDTRVLLHKANMHYKYYGSHIVREAIRDSPYEKLEPIVSKFTAFVFSPDTDVTTLQNIIKKSKKMFLIAGALEGHVLKLEQFMKYGAMDITTAQSNLVHILQSAGGVNLTQQLTYHPSTLVSRLKQIGTNETTSNDNEQSVPV